MMKTIRLGTFNVPRLKVNVAPLIETYAHTLMKGNYFLLLGNAITSNQHGYFINTYNPGEPSVSLCSIHLTLRVYRCLRRIREMIIKLEI